ncbi:hypothetical protein RB1133 [Rhodopirellula baltica SH 1]|uniref:Uncharacterized protein n=1 Tax=Rhodopirellula baltica (strain DSM 10527 / NCIMB 13988 / SH1) TaxID=243090 RepID=Q7UXT5_RHOBA|nr:hypothetical protein RB1133 [Rhodopirellula baltica SH 1]
MSRLGVSPGSDITEPRLTPNGTYFTNSPSPWEGRAKRGEGYTPGFRFALPGPKRADPPRGRVK